MEPSETDDRVVRVERCDLVAVDQRWAYALEHADAIDFHWDMRSAENPNFFNGRVRMLANYALDGATLSGAFLEIDFKEFLYWREMGEPEAGITDAFGSALIWSNDGGVLLCRQRPGHINTGYAYLPGGFVDANDVDSDGCIDIAASSAREVAEETGLCAPLLARQPGFILTFCKRQLSIGVVYHCDLSSDQLRDRVMAHLSADPGSELAEIVMVHTKSDLDGMALTPFARVLLATLLP
jgi:ADP-ribose pyrophosphatase YjhB (NUDIX family)